MVKPEIVHLLECQLLEQMGVFLIKWAWPKNFACASCSLVLQIRLGLVLSFFKPVPLDVSAVAGSGGIGE